MKFPCLTKTVFIFLVIAALLPMLFAACGSGRDSAEIQNEFQTLMSDIKSGNTESAVGLFPQLFQMSSSDWDSLAESVSGTTIESGEITVTRSRDAYIVQYGKLQLLARKRSDDGSSSGNYSGKWYFSFPDMPKQTIDFIPAQ